MIELTFYFFSALLLLSGILVVSLRKPVHAVLLLIFAFFNAAALFILIGAEYIAMTIVIVYVGAVAVLFLFSVMMIDNNNTNAKRKFISVLPLAIILCGIIFFEMDWAMRRSPEYLLPAEKDATASTLPNTESIGSVLYTDYFLQFQLAGLILLVAMVGAILLTLRHVKFVKRQNIYKQISRNRQEAVAIVNPEFGRGVEVK
ncbi:MAG: NADH-quinone oxidoreductase subunit J [Candidatus Midichloria mitochondrii]|uniref:NADH-quinone oxidoreductase subunit J n=1 Tax=Midichloria mitochondrii (strain IricVA) TaxID=696127 RepID=F7XUT7_MIDMI|nr:NADH-quinone oxidoreductase subunit J [Candidatus Midichloria mitochondrii]AEI88436.1 NADH:ubiquinone oxidoreductase subunit J [Candidatus Midichloria mitochondrii IricVA]MDJ1256192.1 NADH-quinone oxidoreductase subunit J [Candidatus Midichloria mitochondrii]MDJ1287866.1 NADH-quinone oxidoreductase subunit J [Candidatus Midichloria mitochondrii]MDJ1298754.1 NADH-quinone oxidoreductase subunit J [Candidatus Midichloria mitochondrii]MDJ1312908.1 NADH-quinone oxidoreductase subunit J [Candidat